MFFSLRRLISNYSDALLQKKSASRAAYYTDFSVCLDRFFYQTEHITVESFSRGIVTLRARHASARFAVETKKEKLLLCFKKNKIPVKKIICKI